MFAPIEEMPTGIIGFEAHGCITGEDRQEVLEPRIVSALADGGRVKLLYLAGMDFAGYDEGGVFDDAVFGTRHFTHSSGSRLSASTARMRMLSKRLPGSCRRRSDASRVAISTRPRPGWPNNLSRPSSGRR